GSDVPGSTDERLAALPMSSGSCPGQILAGIPRVRILRGALAGAIAGLVGAYAMERFQALWSETEKRARPRQTAGAAKDEPTTVKAAERAVETVLHVELPHEVEAVAGW